MVVAAAVAFGARVVFAGPGSFAGRDDGAIWPADRGGALCAGSADVVTGGDGRADTGVDGVGRDAVAACDELRDGPTTGFDCAPAVTDTWAVPRGDGRSR